MDSFYPLLRELWVVWLMAIFLGIVAWALWPSRRRKKQMDDAANIPFRDDEGSADAAGAARNDEKDR